MQHRKCPFPGQHLISADRVPYKDDEIVGPVMQSVIKSSSESTSQRAAIEIHYKLRVTVNCRGIRLVKVSSSLYKNYTLLFSYKGS